MPNRPASPLHTAAGHCIGTGEEHTRRACTHRREEHSIIIEGDTNGFRTVRTDTIDLLLSEQDEAAALHNERVSRISALLALHHGLPTRLVREIRRYAPLHDIGKLFLDHDLLNKSEELTPEEYRRIQQHTLLSAELFIGPELSTARNIALYHHERYDGSGYPFGLKGNEIPVEAQIVALADVFDALRASRSYKKSFTAAETLEEINADEGRVNRHHFNPQLLCLLTGNIDTIEKKIYCSTEIGANRVQ